mgnify:CR=1 FL=1
MADNITDMDAIEWLNRDDACTEFHTTDGKTIMSNEIVELMCSAYEAAGVLGYKTTCQRVVTNVAYALVVGPGDSYCPQLSESTVKTLANRVAHDDGERERFVARLELDSDEYTPVSEILTDNRTYRNLHAVAWLIAREGHEASQRL